MLAPDIWSSVDANVTGFRKVDLPAAAKAGNYSFIHAVLSDSKVLRGRVG